MSSKTNSPKPVTLITGASEGIGRAIAVEYAKAGKTLLLIARHQEPLAELADQLTTNYGVKAHIYPADLTTNEGRDGIRKILNDKNIYVDILVNNAGIGLCDEFIAHTPDELNQLIELNITALTELCHQFLPSMLAKKSGGILNIASLGGFTPGPYQAAYYASKAYVISLTEALNQEVYGSHVKISVVAPGPVDTEFHRKMGAGNALYLKAFGCISAEKTARAAIRGFNRNQTIITPGLFNTISAYSLRILPHTITTPVIAWLLKPRK